MTKDKPKRGKTALMADQKNRHPSCSPQPAITLRNGHKQFSDTRDHFQKRVSVEQ